MDNKKGKYEIMSLLQTKYGVYSLYYKRWKQIHIPMYSAELHPQNKSKIVKEQWEGLKNALSAESKGLRLNSIMIEILNPYNNIVLMPLLEIPDVTTKPLRLVFRSIDTTLRPKNIRYIAWGIALLLCSASMLLNLVSKLRDKSKESCQKILIKNAFETFIEVVTLPLFLVYIFQFGGWVNKIDYIKHEFGTVKTLDETTAFANIYEGHNLHTISTNNDQKLLTPYLIGYTLLILKYMSWHSGTSVLASTISYAFGDIMDTAAVVIVLLSGFGAFGHCLFGIGGGSYDFLSFGSGFNTMARLSFGLLEYDEYMSDGHGQGYEGVGLSNELYEIWNTLDVLYTLKYNYCKHLNRSYQ